MKGTPMLTKEQIERCRAAWCHCSPETGHAPCETCALCDMALASLRVQEGVMVREPTDKMVWAGMTQSEQAAAVNGDLSGVSRVIRQWQKMLAAAPSAQNAAPTHWPRVPPLKDDELKALLRFRDTSDDNEGYDVDELMMMRLADIGVVQKLRGKIYRLTGLGVAITDDHWGQSTQNVERQEDRTGEAPHQELRPQSTVPPAVSAPSAEEKFTLAHNVLNRVDMLLSEAGFKQDASVRHQLSIAKSIFREAEASLKPKEGGAG